jgi:hypothetical protein
MISETLELWNNHQFNSILTSRGSAGSACRHIYLRYYDIYDTHIANFDKIAVRLLQDHINHIERYCNSAGMKLSVARYGNKSFDWSTTKKMNSLSISRTALVLAALSSTIFCFHIFPQQPPQHLRWKDNCISRSTSSATPKEQKLDWQQPIKPLSMGKEAYTEEFVEDYYEELDDLDDNDENSQFIFPGQRNNKTINEYVFLQFTI